MTIYGPTGGVVVGQPISPYFGAQNGASPAGGPITQQSTTAPTAGGMQATGVQMSLLEACSRGLMPRNAYLASVASVAPSAGVSNTNGDALSVDEAMSSGNGAEECGGVAVNPNAGTPIAVTTGGVNTQIFVEGIANANGALSTGPTPTNTESVTGAPVPGSMTTASVALVTNSFAG
jgi:hypothetical protein